MKKTNGDYLGKCCNILTRSLYKLCKESYGKSTGEKGYDIKNIKDTLSAVKEAEALIASLEKNTESTPEILRVIFSDEEMCE